MESISIAAEGKKERYEQLLPQLKALVESESDAVAAMANVSAALKYTFPRYTWVGFYRMVGGELVLGPFQGKVACVRIKIGRGVCGSAAAQRTAIVVPDVEHFPGHIACDPDSRSEIVVPLIHGGDLFGVLDVDSYELGAFDDTDRVQLERIAAMVSEKFHQSR